MQVPADLEKMYAHYLDLSSKDIEKVQVSPEMILLLIERIAELETDIKNPNSYLHAKCKERS